MTEISKHLDPNNIQNLEKKYMDEIWKLIDSKEFLETLFGVSKRINKNFKNWKVDFDMTNFFNVSFERACDYYLPKELSSKPWPSPLSSDLAFYSKDNDCIINIDAKTINCKPGTNEGDVEDLQVKPNQSTISSLPLNEDNNINGSGYNYAGLLFKGRIPSFDKDFDDKKDLPVICYTIKCIYYSDINKNKFDLSELWLSNIPHPLVYEKNWKGENILDNFKSYKYITEFPNLNIKKYQQIDKKHFKKDDKIEFKRKLKNKDKIFYLDKKLKNPFPLYKNCNLAWTEKLVGSAGKKKWVYAIPIESGSVRLISKPDRVDGEGNKWKGVKKKKLSRSSQKLIN